jgi:hypothetical protein
VTRKAHEPDAVIRRNGREWRELWRRVLAHTIAKRDAIPMYALCWALETLCRAGYEKERVLLFIQATWARFRRVLGPVALRPPPPPAPPPEIPAAPRRDAPQREHAEHARKLERIIENAQRELERAREAEREGYLDFCERVTAARDEFGEAHTWLVNVLGWSLEVLYRTGHSDDELAGVVIETFGVIRGHDRPPLPWANPLESFGFR